MVPSVLDSQPPSSTLYTKFFLCGVLIFLCFTTPPLTSAQINNRTEDDRQALLCFKSGISNDPTGVLASWYSLNFCNWQGVTCSTAFPIRVVSVDLSSLKLEGQLSSCLMNLTSLVQMDLSNNSLSGSIPDEISALPELQILMLGINNLQGSIPPSLGTAESLNYVDLSGNILSGVIPDSLTKSLSLNVLILSQNNLSGEIPGFLFQNSSKLARVDLGQNFLSGVIPDFQNMESLQFLDLTANILSGTIPPSLGNISSLSSIFLAQNNLTGHIPNTLGQISKLSILDLSDNRLSGNVPAMLYNVSSLKAFSLSNNWLIGQIPSNIGHSLPNLELLIMSGNKFHGRVPASLANMLKLQVIDLSTNFLSGSVPSLGSLSNLNRLLLGSNRLQAEDWAFLNSLTNCSQLSWLYMDQNFLNGSLPKSVGNLSVKLERLSFGGNEISGKIPAEIGNLVNLALLEMDQNKLSGIIPPSFGNLRKLVILILSKNRLSGEIPSSIGNFTQLTKLNLDDNMLSGNIPASLGNCNRLLMLNLSVNNLDGSIPLEVLNISSLSLGLDLSNNNLTGTILPEIGNLINLQVLNISHNKLSGKLPPAIGQCFGLLSLKMEDNMLSGFIPDAFKNLEAIQQIDFSENNLFGTIPESLGNLKTLYYLNISYNKLEGPIPTSGIFKNSSAVVLEGNKALCQQIAIFELPICPTASTKSRRINVRLLTITVPPVTIALLSFMCVAATVIKGRATEPVESYRETMKKVSYGDIVKATNWFSPVNRISTSHTASVYIGRFEFDTDLVAIKIFHLDRHSSLNSFFTECEVLKHTRHRNLIQAITACSTVDSNNTEFKALVYEFMANGSLDMWIHPRLYQGIPRRLLSLGQRISIAADVASALDYLHNQLIPPLIHCDLKPNNILLDYDMTSRIGDFGSAKFPSLSINSNPKDLGCAGGTIGYIAPEYGMGCKISTGGDVYSFGVLLLEMLTAKRPTDALFVNGLSLHKYVDSAFPHKINEILDSQMTQDDEYIHNQCMENYIIPLFQIGLMCSKESPKDRPGMQEVRAKIVNIQEAFVDTF